MTDKEVEDIIKSNMNLQMNLAGIRADFEEKLQRTWVGLTDEDWNRSKHNYDFQQGVDWAEDRLKGKNAQN